MTDKEEKIDRLKGQTVYPATRYSKSSLNLHQYLVGQLARNPAIVNSAPSVSARHIANKIKEVADKLIEEMVKDYD